MEYQSNKNDLLTLTNLVLNLQETVSNLMNNQIKNNKNNDNLCYDDKFLSTIEIIRNDINKNRNQLESLYNITNQKILDENKIFENKYLSDLNDIKKQIDKLNFIIIDNDNYYNNNLKLNDQEISSIRKIINENEFNKDLIKIDIDNLKKNISSNKIEFNNLINNLQNILEYKIQIIDSNFNSYFSDIDNKFTEYFDELQFINNKIQEIDDNNNNDNNNLIKNLINKNNEVMMQLNDDNNE